MEKKELKMYEAPVVEVVEMEAQGVICGSGEFESPFNPGDTPDDGELFS